MLTKVKIKLPLIWFMKLNYGYQNIMIIFGVKMH